MTKKPTEIFDSEWAILKVLWENEPTTAPTVQELLSQDRGWAYATVKTMMDRMVQKGLLTVEKIRNLHLYRSAISKTRAQESELAKTIKRAFDGTFNPFIQFLIEDGQLSDQEVQYIETLLKNRKRQKRNVRK